MGKRIERESRLARRQAVLRKAGIDKLAPGSASGPAVNSTRFSFSLETCRSRPPSYILAASSGFATPLTIESASSPKVELVRMPYRGVPKIQGSTADIARTFQLSDLYTEEKQHEGDTGVDDRQIESRSRYRAQAFNHASSGVGSQHYMRVLLLPEDILAVRNHGVD